MNLTTNKPMIYDLCRLFLKNNQPPIVPQVGLKANSSGKNLRDVFYRNFQSLLDVSEINHMQHPRLYLFNHSTIRPFDDQTMRLPSELNLFFNSKTLPMIHLEDVELPIEGIEPQKKRIKYNSSTHQPLRRLPPPDFLAFQLLCHAVHLSLKNLHKASPTELIFKNWKLSDLNSSFHPAPEHVTRKQLALDTYDPSNFHPFTILETKNLHSFLASASSFFTLLFHPVWYSLRLFSFESFVSIVFEFYELKSKIPFPSRV